MARTDEQIKKEIVDELFWDTRIDASKVSIKVENGVVALSGSVPTLDHLAETRAVAWGTAGVIDVVDDIAVAHISPVPHSDSEIEARANSLLSWDPAIVESDITVAVADGIATLEGHVDAHWKRSYVENKISGLEGLLGVENKLAVVLTHKIEDEVIAEDIIAAMDRNIDVEPDDVEVEVHNGIVTITGVVPTRAARLAAERSASRTAGVIEVRNQVRVEPL